MPFNAKVFRVLIASPGDLAEDRDVATSAIQEWNIQHADAESIVLLPIRWETHSTPQIGERPQDVITRELVQTSDILIGLFWSRIGSSTGPALSHTVEEINHFVAAGKPAMLSSDISKPNRSSTARDP